MGLEKMQTMEEVIGKCIKARRNRRFDIEAKDIPNKKKENRVKWVRVGLKKLQRLELPKEKLNWIDYADNGSKTKDN